MNPDYIIGSKQPHILYADYVGDTSKLAPKSEEAAAKEDARLASAPQAPKPDGEDFTFDDFIDIINPLQHIPVVNYIYRAITGDTIKGFAEIAGGGLFGGPLGLVGGAISAMFNDETGHGAAETMVADLLGIEDHKTMVAKADRSPKTPDLDNATLETQLAAATAPEGKQTLDTQLASTMPKAQTLDAQLAAATLPPVANKARLPYGGMMDMAAVDAARKGAPSASDEAAQAMQVASASDDEGEDASAPLAAATPAPAANAAAVAEGQKFFSLAKAKRLGNGAHIAMPINPGPDLRLKSVTQMATSSAHAPTPVATAVIPIPTDQEAEARKILGLSDAATPLAENDAALPAVPGLSPADADLLPGHGIAQNLPPALIEDMMKMGLQKYQQGISNGSLNAPPALDIRG